MASKESKIIERRVLRSYLSSLCCITLVLFLMGLAGAFSLNANALLRYFKENIPIAVIFQDNVLDESLVQKLDSIKEYPFVKQAVIVSKEDAKKEMQLTLGEDFLDAFKDNPLPVSIEINLFSKYFNADSIAIIESTLSKMSNVREVSYEEHIVSSVSDNLRKVTVVLIIFVAILLGIALTLLSSTIRLSIFSKRFTIHTMCLVGATKAFIRKPFVRRSAWQGFLSALLAIAFVTLVLFFMQRNFSDIFGLISPVFFAGLFVAIILVGQTICIFTTHIVVNQIVKLENEELYL